ncbi:MotA/TolQ/ExbB proton channel family protein [Peptococcaceae bacterium]|nr:MotA/TolQ/ExbB proton channel family protein [Peptococcaceae bacterium]
MEGLGILQSMLFLISNAFLYPVLILLLVLLVITLVKLGEFIFEYSVRTRNTKKAETAILNAKQLLDKQAFDKVVPVLKQSYNNPVVTGYIKEVSGIINDCHLAKVEKTLQEYEIRVLKKLEPTKIISQVGPILGLMGTLIPLSPGLLGLINGDIEILARSLIIAFSTTVVGLASAGVAFVITTVRRRWYSQDISDIEYISAVLFNNGSLGVSEQEIERYKASKPGIA